MDVVGSEERSAEDAPVVRVINLILLNAIRKEATEIQIEPDQESLVVNYRLEGELASEMAPPKKMHEGIVARLKVMSGLNLTKHDEPQEGELPLIVGRNEEKKFRIRFEPTPLGEKVVIWL